MHAKRVRSCCVRDGRAQGYELSCEAAIRLDRNTGVDKAEGDNKKYLGNMRTPWQGAEGIAWLCGTDQEDRNSAFYLNRKHKTKLAKVLHEMARNDQGHWWRRTWRSGARDTRPRSNCVVPVEEKRKVKVKWRRVKAKKFVGKQIRLSPPTAWGNSYWTEACRIVFFSVSMRLSASVLKRKLNTLPSCCATSPCFLFFFFFFFFSSSSYHRISLSLLLFFSFVSCTILSFNFISSYLRRDSTRSRRRPRTNTPPLRKVRRVSLSNISWQEPHRSSRSHRTDVVRSFRLDLPDTWKCLLGALALHHRGHVLSKGRILRELQRPEILRTFDMFEGFGYGFGSIASISVILLNRCPILRTCGSKLGKCPWLLDWACGVVRILMRKDTVYIHIYGMNIGILNIWVNEWFEKYVPQAPSTSRWMTRSSCTSPQTPPPCSLSHLLFFFVALRYLRPKGFAPPSPPILFLSVKFSRNVFTFLRFFFLSLSLSKTMMNVLYDWWCTIGRDNKILEWKSLSLSLSFLLSLTHTTHSLKEIWKLFFRNICPQTPWSTTTL